MFDVEIKFKTNVFNLDFPHEKEQYERIHQMAYVEREEGWSILNKNQMMTQEGAILAFVEWTEPK